MTFNWYCQIQEFRYQQGAFQIMQLGVLVDNRAQSSQEASRTGRLL